MKPTLRVWSQGANVKLLQEGLNQAAPHLVPPLTTDGIFGAKTLARVREFQGFAKITPDGVVGPDTWRALGELLAGLLTPPGTPPGPPTGEPPLDLRPLTSVSGLKTSVQESAWTPVDPSLISEYAFRWTGVVGQGTISYFELAEKVVPKWFGVLVPNGVASFDRVHLFFHPTPGQAGYHDSHYDQLGDWWKVWHYLSDAMGTQFCASVSNRVMIMPLMTQGSAQNGGMLPQRWRSIFAQILGSLGPGGGAPVPVSSLVVSSFSSGISYSHHFRMKAGLGSELRGVIDFDGAFSTSKHLSAAINQPAGRIVRALQAPTSEKTLAASAAANLFPLPPPRWKHSPWPFANAYQIHGLIPQTMMYTAAWRLG